MLNSGVEIHKTTSMFSKLKKKHANGKVIAESCIVLIAIPARIFCNSDLKSMLNNATVMEKYMHTVHLRDSFNISWSNEYPKKLKSVPAEMAAIRIFNSSHPTNTQ